MYTLTLNPLLYQIIKKIVSLIVADIDGVKRVRDKKTIRKYLKWKLRIILARFCIKRKKKILNVLVGILMLELFSNE